MASRMEGHLPLFSEKEGRITRMPLHTKCRLLWIVLALMTVLSGCVNTDDSRDLDNGHENGKRSVSL